jgi:hypothetical protein
MAFLLTLSIFSPDTRTKPQAQTADTRCSIKFEAQTLSRAPHSGHLSVDNTKSILSRDKVHHVHLGQLTQVNKSFSLPSVVDNLFPLKNQSNTESFMISLFAPKHAPFCLAEHWQARQQNELCAYLSQFASPAEQITL